MVPSSLPRVVPVKVFACLVSVFVLGVWLTSCVSGDTNSPTNTNGSAPTSANSSDTDSKKKVLTTFTILADIAQNVAGDKLTVTSITRIGAEIHSYEPTPSDLTKAQDADLILYNGMELERWFQQFLGNLQNVPSVLLTEGIEPVPIAEGPYGGKPKSSCLDVTSKCLDLRGEYSPSLC